MPATLTPTVLRDRLDRPDNDVILIDVRTGGEFETGHIPGSFNVPLDALNEHCARLGRVDREVVLICQSGGRASQAEQRLADAGLSTVHVLDGGMNAWQAAGGDVKSVSDRWAMERQVRLVAGSLALAGVLASTRIPKAKWLAGFIGSGLTFSAVTNTCGMAMVLAKLPYNRAAHTDVEAVVDQVTSQCGLRDAA